MIILNDQLIFEMNTTLMSSGNFDSNINSSKITHSQMERVKSASNRITLKEGNYVIEKSEYEKKLESNFKPVQKPNSARKSNKDINQRNEKISIEIKEKGIKKVK